MYAKDPGPGSFCLVCVYYVRKGFGARAQTASSAYTMYAKDSGPGSFCLVCVYYVRKRSRGPSSFCLVCVYCVRKRSRARAHFAPIAYTIYAKDSEPELKLPRLRILCTQKIGSGLWAASSAYTMYAKDPGPGLKLPRLRILCTQKIRSPGSSCLVCVYYVRKK